MLCQVDTELADLLQTLSVQWEYLSIPSGSRLLDSNGPMVLPSLDVQMQ